MRTIALRLIGGLLILAGSAALFLGALVVGVFGADGRIDTDPLRVSSSATALVSDTARIDAGLPSGLDFAKVYISASSINDKDVFIGVGPARDVLTYVSGAPYDVLTGVSGRPGDEDAVNVRRVAGEGSPPAPDAEAFWNQQSQGAGLQDFAWPIASGRYLFVVMNADGSPNVDVQLTIGISAPWLFPAGVAAVLAGLVLTCLGAVCLFLGFRRPKVRSSLTYAVAASSADALVSEATPSALGNDANGEPPPTSDVQEPPHAPPREADEGQS